MAVYGNYYTRGTKMLKEFKIRFERRCSSPIGVIIGSVWENSFITGERHHYASAGNCSWEDRSDIGENRHKGCRRCSGAFDNVRAIFTDGNRFSDNSPLAFFVTKAILAFRKRRETTGTETFRARKAVGEIRDL